MIRQNKVIHGVLDKTGVHEVAFGFQILLGEKKFVWYYMSV